MGGRVTVLEEQSAEATGEGATQLQRRLQHFGDVRSTGLQTEQLLLWSGAN